MHHNALATAALEQLANLGKSHMHSWEKAAECKQQQAADTVKPETAADSSYMHL